MRRPSSEIQGLRSCPVLDSSVISWMVAASMLTVWSIQCGRQPAEPVPSSDPSAPPSDAPLPAGDRNPHPTRGTRRTSQIRTGRSYQFRSGLTPTGRQRRLWRLVSLAYFVTWAWNRWNLPPLRFEEKYSSQPSSLSTGSSSSMLPFTVGISFGVLKSSVALCRVAYHRFAAPSPPPAGRCELNTMIRSSGDTDGLASPLPLLITGTVVEAPKFGSVPPRVATEICCGAPPRLGAR